MSDLEPSAFEARDSENARVVAGPTGEPARGQGLASRGPLFRLLVCGVLLYHMLAVVAANLPVGSALGAGPRAPFDAYLRWTGNWQSWTMFTTIPYYLRLQPELVARMADGSEQVHGASLPGLKPLDPGVRMGTLVFRYIWPGSDYRPYVKAYLARGCEEIVKSGKPKPEFLALRLRAQRIQELKKVRSTGHISVPYTTNGKVVERCKP